MSGAASEGDKSRVRDAAKAARTRGGERPPARDREPPDGMPEECPVRPLGVNGRTRYYLDAERQIQDLPAREHVRTEILGLFHGDDAWLRSVPRWQRMNDSGTVTGWKPEIVAADMMAACAVRGLWDPNKRERGRGAWRGDHDELVIHTGDRIMVFEKRDNPWDGHGDYEPDLIGRYVYSAAAPVGAPAARLAERHPGEALYDLLQTWRWKRGDLDATILLGWIGAAMIGGALDWRAVVWLTGGAGTGKSTLQKLIKLLFGDALIDLADTTGAFIWQTLGHQTLPVAVDELEAEEDNRKALAVIKLARIAASGGQLGRGSDRHVPVSFTLRSCFMFSSILVPPLNGADRSRIAILDLLELPEGAAVPEMHAEAMREMGAQLRRRMIDGWARFELTLARYRRGLIERGHSARGADQFGTLLACADLLLFGEFPDKDAADDWLRRMHAADLSETVDNERDEAQCLQHLLGTPVDAVKGGERFNLGEWINRAAGRAEFDDVTEARRITGKLGVRIERVDNAAFVAVATNHAGLQAAYERTRWQTPRGSMGVWVQALRRLPGARATIAPLYFGGPNSQAVLLPLALIPLPDRPAQDRFGTIPDHI